MKMTHVVRKRLALLLSMVLMLTSIPMTAGASIPTGGDGWEMKGIEIPNELPLKVGEKTEITVVAIASVPDASMADATASASNALKASLVGSDITVSKEGIVKASVNKEEGTITVEGLKEGEVTLTVGKNPYAQECKITVTPQEAPKELATVEDFELEQNVVIDMAVEKERLVKITPVFSADSEGKDKKAAWDAYFWKSGEWDVPKVSGTAIEATWDGADKDACEKEGIETAETGAVKVVPKEVGTATLIIKRGTVSKRCTVRVIDSNAAENVIVGLTIRPDEVTIDMNEITSEVIKYAPVFKEGTTKEEKDAAMNDYWDGKNIPAVNYVVESDKDIVSVSWEGGYDPETYEASIRITGLDGGEATIKTVYKDLESIPCKVTVIKSDDVKVLEGRGKVEPIGEGQVSLPDGVTMDEVDFDGIQKALQESAVVQFSEDTALKLENLLKDEDASSIRILPEVTINNVKMTKAEDGTVVVSSIEAEMTLDIQVFGGTISESEKNAVVEKILNSGYPFTMSVSVPGKTARGGMNYVQWTHNGNGGNDVLEDEVTAIENPNNETRGIAKVTTTAFSPFILTFVKDDNTTGGGSSSSGGGGGSSRTTAATGKWIQDAIGWWYQNPNGTWPSNGWAQLTWNGVSNWYYFNADGYMVTGWITVDGLRYYLHPVSDGTQGYMYTGWHEIDGKNYYFSEVSDGTKGHLLVNTTTPDGHQVGADGARIN